MWPPASQARPRHKAFDRGVSTSAGIVALPCTMMRGGTSRGAFFNAADLPEDPDLRDRVLLAAMGSPHPLQVDGIGGGNPLTSKVAIVGPSADRRADVDYLFAQVNVDRAAVDTKAACGNILAAVGPYAIETGLVAPEAPITVVRVRNVNTGAITLATLETPDGRLRYDGEETLPGLDSPAAPIRLSFVDAAGAMTGKLLPSGNSRETIDGIGVSLVDSGIAAMIVDAREFGLSGAENPAEIDADRALLDRVEAMRLEAGRRMGLGDVSQSVVPKVALVSPPVTGGTIRSRYLMPWRCHASHAVTGALCLAAAMTVPGTVAADVAAKSGSGQVGIEHPAGVLQLGVEGEAERLVASVVRSARLLFQGYVYVPARAFEREEAARAHAHPEAAEA